MNEPQLGGPGLDGDLGDTFGGSRRWRSMALMTVDMAVGRIMTMAATIMAGMAVQRLAARCWPLGSGALIGGAVVASQQPAYRPPPPVYYQPPPPNYYAPRPPAVYYGY